MPKGKKIMTAAEITAKRMELDKKHKELQVMEQKIAEFSAEENKLKASLKAKGEEYYKNFVLYLGETVKPEKKVSDLLFATTAQLPTSDQWKSLIELKGQGVADLEVKIYSVGKTGKLTKIRQEKLAKMLTVYNAADVKTTERMLVMAKDFKAATVAK